MSEWTPLHRREDGTFVVLFRGYPYHVTKDDPLYLEVSEATEGRELTPEIPPDPPVFQRNTRVVTALEFLNRLTPDERTTIRRAARASEGLEDWLDMLRAAQEVNLDDPRTISGLNAMVNAGLLSPKRRDEILETE
jgi:hypothetical protein